MADEPAPVVEPVAAPVVEPVAVVETPPAPEPTLLGGATAVEPPAEGEAKPEATDPKPEGAADPKPESAPVLLTPADYTFTAPEGMELDPTTLAPFQELAAELQLPKDKAQALLNLHTAQLAASQAATLESFQTTQAAWKAAVLALPEFTGAEGVTTKAAIGRMMDEYGSPEVKAILDATGAGNNPHVVKMFVGLAKALSEGAPAPQGGVPKPNGARTPGQIFYPDQTQ